MMSEAEISQWFLVKSRYGFNRYIFDLAFLLYYRENGNKMKLPSKKG